MQLIFDNLVALLVGTVVIVILLGLTTNWSTESRDRTRQHMTREMQRNLAEMFERDVLNVGANVPVGEPIIVENSPTRFAFNGAVNGSGAAQLIEYRLMEEPQANGSSLYRVERWVEGAYTGGSPGLMRWFEVKLLKTDAAGQDVPATTYAEARKIMIRFQAVLPYASEVGSDQASLRQMNWESVYQPSLLDR